MRTANRAHLALGVVLVVAALNFLWQLGSSSYFVDEVLSLQVASHSLGGLLHAVSHTEITPPAYFLFQHEWLARAGSQAEWVARLPSVACGVLLVAAVYWLASLVSANLMVSLGAAALAALSPFVLEYAQRAQGYLFAALLVTVAVCSVLQVRALVRAGAGVADRRRDRSGAGDVHELHGRDRDRDAVRVGRLARRAARPLAPARSLAPAR